ncbi:ROK family transcriptional regulator [Actinocrispum wychmicini]|uniref:ROK family transcriptional regulator n=1 Tax=Actinocrispum wychmicini TaxID=1213861 RepID=UPI001404C1B6|nr:ROK family transcriptional regulator [Actinocrispum wychmicini]
MTQLRFAQKGTKGLLRARNDVLVLQCVAAGGDRCSRTDVARETGLPQATVSEIVAEMIERRLVREAGREAQRIGKPRVLLELDSDHHHFVGVHLGRGRIRASRLTLTGHIVESTTVPHMLGDDTLATIATAVGRLAKSGDAEISGVGVAAPGIIGDDGTIREAVNYGWRMMPLGQELSRRCGGLPVHVVNDANAVALSEVALSTVDVDTVVVLWIGTGIGAGIVLDGRLYRGAEFRSGEIGHIDTGASLRCRCGLIGCLETVAAEPTIVGAASESDIQQFLAGADDADSRALGERIRRAAQALARLLSTLGGTLDVTDFILGGPFSSHPLAPAVLGAVNDVLAVRVMSGFSPLKVRFTTLGAHSLIFGAAAHAIRQELGVMIAMPAGLAEGVPPEEGSVDSGG